MGESKDYKAMKRLEEIIVDIESEEVDVDALSEKVQEAVSLIKMCKEKIQKAEMDVKKVVDDLQEVKGDT